MQPFSWQELRLRAAEYLEDRALDNLRSFRRALASVDERRALETGRKRAELAARRAFRQVPAYRRFLLDQGLSSADVPFEQLPTMSKDAYVRKYPTEERCVGGQFLEPGVAIDESSGSTGTPYNWVRGIDERRRTRREMARMVDYGLGERPRITINAFSMGAWATGVNMGEAMELHGVVKSTGPDLEKILHTLQFFGPKPGYFICGYPPFLKLVLDSMLDRGFPIQEYELHGLVGGEGMSEAFRRYLLKHFKTCHSGYGASDLEMGIAAETPESIAIRSLLHDDAQLRAAVLDGDHRVPMVFQYNPLSHYLETNERDELIVTLNYSRVLSPRIRYNIGDEARLFARSDLLARLAKIANWRPPAAEAQLPFPYLMLFGRRDQTISIMGANIYPEDLERVLYGLPELATGMASFSISVEDRGAGEAFPRLCVEWLTESVPALPLDQLAKQVRAGLLEINSDFRNAANEYSEALNFDVQVHGFATGPFAGRSRRIKNRYLENAKP